MALASKCEIPFKLWLEINELQDVACAIALAPISLDELLSLNDADRSAILCAYGLNQNQINRFVEALNSSKKHYNHSDSFHSEKSNIETRNVYNYNENFFLQFQSLGIGHNDDQRKQACHVFPGNFDEALDYLIQLQKEHFLDDKELDTFQHNDIQRREPLEQKLSDNDNDDDAWEYNEDIKEAKEDDNHSTLYHSDMELEDDDGFVDDEYPVWPLIIPNNCHYNRGTGKMTVDHNKKRDKLKVYRPALDFIHKIKSKIATISIVGRARTGKSLVAGELYAPGHIPCPFDLGHKMDACTYGIWISAKTIPHPHEQDTVILIFDVEGTGYHEANKQSDMQLMVITLLLSSYFIYNSTATFTAASLDEIDFFTQLTQQIQSTPNDDSGHDFQKFFPVFMWLLRDSFLEPEIDGKTVTVREYFTQKVLKPERGISQRVQTRTKLRAVLMEMFQKYDAFALQIPHANKRMLKQLGTISRDRLEKDFVDGLHVFCEKVIRDTKCKVLFSKDAIGNDSYAVCTGSHLAAWIVECVQSVNDPNKVPQISSMTAAVMASVYRDSKKKALHQYNHKMQLELKQLQQNDAKQPLEEDEIIDLHLRIFNQILKEDAKSLQMVNDIDSKANKSTVHQQQCKVYRELCEEIGHNTDITNIGKQGRLYQILAENRRLSEEFCQKYLSEYYNGYIYPLLQVSQFIEMQQVTDAFETMWQKYYAICKGPTKDKCWAAFNDREMSKAMANFKKCKGFNDEILLREQENIRQKEEARQLQQQYDEHRKQTDLQTTLMQDEIKRQQEQMNEESKAHQLQIQQADQRMNDMQTTHANMNKEMIEKSRREKDEMKRRMNNIQTQQRQQIQNMQNQLNAARRRPAPQPQVVHVHKKSGCLIM